jgi:hypothetical protein
MKHIKTHQESSSQNFASYGAHERELNELFGNLTVHDRTLQPETQRIAL